MLNFTQKEFDNLLEYSCSLPTMTTIGKTWKCDLNFGKATKKNKWIVRRYEEKIPYDPNMVIVKEYKYKILNEVETLVRDRLYA